MKTCVFMLLVFSFVFPLHVNAEDFLGAPVVSTGKTILKTEARLELETDRSHDEVLQFYKEALKNASDIKYRDWKDYTYIEDDGNRLWHSITIAKNDKTGAAVVIVKDNWTWIIGTLFLRFVGVFVVLFIVFAGMSISGWIISGWVRRMEAKREPL
ncbi:MAG TPA: hypothetical protein PKV75_10215 [Desulfobacterales bacterium]|nr:hypothetical protein [Desulfobacterales bacterium]